METGNHTNGAFISVSKHGGALYQHINLRKPIQPSIVFLEPPAATLEVMKTQHRVSKKLGHKHKETKEKCSFVVSSQSAPPAFSGCGWSLSWGAPSDPPLPSVHDLSCRGPGCSERCRSLPRRRRPRFRRTTRQTAAASHKRNNLKDSGGGHTPRHSMWDDVKKAASVL